MDSRKGRPVEGGIRTPAAGGIVGGDTRGLGFGWVGCRRCIDMLGMERWGRRSIRAEGCWGGRDRRLCGRVGGRRGEGIWLTFFGLFFGFSYGEG